jgi:hypothetical protein
MNNQAEHSGVCGDSRNQYWVSPGGPTEASATIWDAQLSHGVLTVLWIACPGPNVSSAHRATAGVTSVLQALVVGAYAAYLFTVVYE